jgi:hypothetical protein
MKRPILSGVFGATMLAVLLPGTAFAHGFGDRYDLPVPLGLYMSAAGAAVVLSFVVIGVFAKRDIGGSYPQHDLRRRNLGRALAHPITLDTARALSAFVFILYLLAGLFGTEEPNANLVPTMTWVLFWVGIAYFSALVGDVWSLINPWKVLFGYAESLVWKLTGRDLARYEPYPERWSAWPAVLLFLAFAWVEVVYTGSGVPLSVVTLALGYSAVTLLGMWWFGREEWLRNGEVFTIVFGFLATFAPTQVAESEDPDAEDHSFVLRPWGAGLLTVPKPEISRAALLVLMLATVSFDGFVETGTWTEILVSLLPAFSFFGSYAFSAMTTIGLLLAPVLFFGVFALTAWLMGWLVNSPLGAVYLIRTFVFSLVPIALAYHIAHFFSFLMIQGQRLIPLASDPFGWGWDLFGTADYAIDIGVVNARFVWFLSIAAIVVGHIVAVYVAHVYALRTFPGKGDAVRSQYPMLVLMAGYTMVSLWIVAQPIVES